MSKNKRKKDVSGKRKRKRKRERIVKYMLLFSIILMLLSSLAPILGQ